MSHTSSFYLSYLLRSCLPHSAVSQAKQCHAQILLQGLLPNATLQTDLLLVYSRCGLLRHARQVFDGMLHKNMHSWNIMIASHVENSLYSDAIAVFCKFQRMGLRPDHYTLPPLFKASIGVGDTSLGKTFHALVIKLGYEEYVIVGSCLLESYAESGAMSEARCVFSDMSFKDSAAWNLMISRFARTGLYMDALNCLRGMILNEVKIDSMTFPSVLNACGREGDLMKGKEVHGQIVKGFMFSADAAIGNALIDMYGNCSHSGLVDQGMQIFNSIHSEYGFEPSVEHYACIVDLLGRCGYLVEALQILESMKSSATTSIWGALLAGCMMHKNVKIGEIAAHHLFQIEPNNASNYIALCSIYETHGMLEGVSSVRTKLRDLDLAKTPGYSGINIAGRFHKFCQGDLSLPPGADECWFLCGAIDAWLCS
ncbi:hypothetical protein K1719_015070 [Acacia pycnantha]|nr:hypothetical protein K1719_015070 [Acacia pycnantha]